MKCCSKLAINWKYYKKTNKSKNRTIMNDGINHKLKKEEIGDVIPLEAQFITHENYATKYRSMRPRYYIKVEKSKVHGYGLFATRPIPKETFLIEYLGINNIFILFFNIRREDIKN